MGEQSADVTAGGKGARGPKTVEQRNSGYQPNEGQDRLGSGEPFARSSGLAFLACQGTGREQKQGEIDGKSVVLLIGGEREKEQDDRGIDAQQPGGPGTEERRARSYGIRGRPQAATPASSGAPRPPKNNREVDTPGKQPDQVQTPVENKGQLVVVHWIAFAQETQHLLVDEVEIEKAVDITGGRNIADGVTGAGIAQPGENVPGGSNGQEEKNSGEQAELTPAAPISGEQQIRHRGEEEKDRGHQPFGQHGQRQGGPGEMKKSRFLVFQADEKCVKSKGQQQR